MKERLLNFNIDMWKLKQKNEKLVETSREKETENQALMRQICNFL